MAENPKDFLMKNRNMVIIGVLVIVAVVAGVFYMNKDKAVNSSSESPIVTLSNRVTTLETSYNNQVIPSQEDIDVLDTRLDDIEESYADYSDNMDTLLQNMSDMQGILTTLAATPTTTPTATPTPTPSATPTPTPTPYVNQAPVIDTFVVSPPVLEAGEDYALVTVTAHDPDNDVLTYTWAASHGVVNGVGSSVYWVKAAAGVNGSVGVIISDGDLSVNYATTIRCNP